MTEPCRPDGGPLQEFIDRLPGREECCWHMVGVQVKVTRVTVEYVDLCIPTPDDGDDLKYVESIMAIVMPMVPNSPPTKVSQVLSVTPTWRVTESFIG